MNSNSFKRHHRIFVLASCALFLAAVFAGSALAQIIAEEEVQQFSQRSDQSTRRIDHQPWSEFLESAVFDVGASTRQPAPRRKMGRRTGMRVSTGSRSRYRYEGNRVLFHLINDDVSAFIAAYRTGLQGIFDTIDYATLSADEQLAFWLNLYNAVLIDEITKNYPTSKPSGLKLRDQDNAPLFEAKLVTINNTQLSLNDIRYGIVYRYWTNLDVIYGFWDGAIGGPSIQAQAYNGANVQKLLHDGARDYVNALRGVEARSGSFRVAEIYDRSRMLFSNWPSDLYRHLDEHAGPEVRELLSNPPQNLRFIPYDTATADINSGETTRFGGSDNPGAISNDQALDQYHHGWLVFGSETNRGGLSEDAAVMNRRRLEAERAERWRQREGSVSIEDVDTEDPDDAVESDTGAADEDANDEEEQANEVAEQ